MGTVAGPRYFFFAERHLVSRCRFAFSALLEQPYLLDSFDLPTVESDTLDAEDFFRKYGKLLLDACCYCYIDPGERKMRWESENYRKVAMAHRLTVSKGRIPEAISNLSAALTAIVCME